MSQQNSLGNIVRFRYLGRIKKPQLTVFYVSAALIVLANLAQFNYLLTEYWFEEDWLSKGPVIWLVSLFVIHRDLSQHEFKNVITRMDLALTAAFVPLLVFGMYIDPLLAPISLLVYAWYLVTSAIDFPRLLIVWLFLLFSLPFYSQLVPGLQLLTVIVTENALGFLGIPALVQEFYIAIPSGQFIVEEGCSGFNYLANNLLLLFLYSLMSKFSIRQFFIGLLITVSLALMLNWIRVILIILFAHHMGIEHSFVEDHLNFGWFLYALFLLPFFYLMLKIDSNNQQKAIHGEIMVKQVISYPAVVLLLIPLIVGYWQQ